MTASSQWTPPSWVRVIVHLTGVGVIVHQTLAGRDPNWLLLVVAVVMMGLAGPDLLDRLVPDPRRQDDDE